MPVNSVAERLRQANHVTVFTGAGVSAESGIPTFRDALTGLWERFDPPDWRLQKRIEPIRASAGDGTNGAERRFFRPSRMRHTWLSLSLRITFQS